MDSGEDSRRQRRGRPHWLAELVAQMTSDRDIISPGRYCAYNAFLGVILLGIAAIIAVDPGHGPESASVALGAAGVALVVAIPVALLRPSWVGRLLAWQGALLILLALVLAAGSMRWALYASAAAPFRYLPGLTLLLLAYGALQATGFGRWRARARGACGARRS